MPSIPDRTFAASCDSISKILSAVIAAIPVVLLIVAAATHNAIMGLLIAPLFTLILGLAYAWSPRGYAISGQSLVVKRLVGNVGIPLESVSVKLEGLLDLRGFFAVKDDVRAGFNEVRGVVNLKSSASPAELAKLKKVVDAHCPVLDILRAPVPVDLRLETERAVQAA